MTSYRFITLSVWWIIALVVAAGVVIAFLAAGGVAWAATALALDILISPIVMLALALFARVFGRLAANREQAEVAEPEHRLQSNILFFLAGFGILGIAVLLVAGSLIQTGEGWERVAGYAVLSAFAALGVVPGVGFALMMLVPALPLRLPSLIGQRKGLYAAARCARSNRLEEAWELAERYRAEHSEDSWGLDMEAFIRLRQGRREEALDIADQTLDINRSAAGFARRSQIWLLLGGAQEALADAEAALALNPKAPLAETIIGDVLVGLRRLDDAIARLQQLKSPYVKSLPLLTLAEALRLRGWHDAAEETYRKVTRYASIERRVGTIDSEGVQAYAWARLGKRAEAEKYARSALTRDDRDPIALHTLALLAMRRDDPDAAFAALQQLLPVNSGTLIGAFNDTELTPLLAEVRFRRLLAWALGAERQVLERVRSNRPVAGSG